MLLDKQTSGIGRIRIGDVSGRDCGGGTANGFSSPLLTSHEAADYLRISREWLEKMRVIGRSPGRGGAPSFVRIGRRVFYRLDELDRFIAANTAASTSEY